jgi:hypothetical protein
LVLRTIPNPFHARGDSCVQRAPGGRGSHASIGTSETGAPWRDPPERYGPWKTAHERLRLWIADGIGDEILAEVIVKDDALGGSPARVGARKKGAAATVHALAVEGEGLGRSRDGRRVLRLFARVRRSAYAQRPSFAQSLRSR